MGYIDHTASGANTMERCLDDGILLCVERPHTVPVYHQMSDIVTVRQARRRTIIPSCQNAFVANDHRANVCAGTSAALGYCIGDVEEILVPRGAAGLQEAHARRRTFLPVPVSPGGALRQWESSRVRCEPGEGLKQWTGAAEFLPLAPACRTEDRPGFETYPP